MSEHKKSGGKSLTVTDDKGQIINNVSLQGKTEGIPTPSPSGEASSVNQSAQGEESIDYATLAQKAGIVGSAEPQPLAADYAEYRVPEDCPFCGVEVAHIGHFGIECNHPDCLGSGVKGLAREFFDMSYVKDEVAKLLDLPARIENTGGGCATIYVGNPDSEGYYPLAVGPGNLENREGFDFPIAQYSDFSVGRDDPSGASNDGSGVYNGLYNAEQLIQFIASEYRRLNPAS